jgi:ATP-dependent DNA helicase RecQ
MIQQIWKPKPAPVWVTAIPSQHHPELVSDFAQRLAAGLGLPFCSALHPYRAGHPQKEMQNSAMQLRNVLRAFKVAEAPNLSSVSAEEKAKGLLPAVSKLATKLATSLGASPRLPPVPVLLVDDMIDSGWTLTIAAVLLRHHGSGPVFPFALAKASPRGS